MFCDALWLRSLRSCSHRTSAEVKIEAMEGWVDRCGGRKCRFPKLGLYPQNGLFMENPIKNGWFGGFPPFIGNPCSSLVQKSPEGTELRGPQRATNPAWCVFYGGGIIGSLVLYGIFQESLVGEGMVKGRSGRTIFFFRNTSGQVEMNVWTSKV